MPYVVTTRTPLDPHEPPDVACQAYATLVDAQYDVDLAIEDHGGSIDEWPDVPAFGGAVGPLPDGTVIVVRPVTWERLTHSAPGLNVWHLTTPPLPEQQARILAAVNGGEGR